MHDGLKRLGVERLHEPPSQWSTDSGVKMAARRRLDGGVHWWGDGSLINDDRHLEIPQLACDPVTTESTISPRVILISGVKSIGVIKTQPHPATGEARRRT